MRYSIEPRERRHVKEYGFLSFARNIGTHAAKAAKNMSNKYSQKLVDKGKKSATDAIKTASKRAIQKTAEATGDLVGNKIAHKVTAKPGPKDVTIASKNHTMKKYSQMKLIMKYRTRDIFLQKKGKKLLMN